MRRIVIITGNSFPNGDAGAVRQAAMCKAFHKIGYIPFVYGMGPSTDFKIKTFDNIEYISLRSGKTSKISKIIERITFANRAVKDINNRFERIDAVLVIDVYPWAFSKIEKIAKKKNAHLIHDSVEWYSKEEFRLGIFDFQYLCKEYTNRIGINKQWRVIAISKYLYSHFRKNKNRVVRIPVIMDSNEYIPNYNLNANKVRFIYAGSPGKKDYLYNILCGFAKLDNNSLSFIEIHIAGITEEQLNKDCAVPRAIIEKLRHSLRIHGRVSRSEAIKLVSESNYSLLFRDSSLRYAKAGFPTKVVESLMLGTPPLCNYSSDLQCYLKDGVNAIIAKDHSIESIARSIKKAISMEKTSIEKMRREARKTGELFFDYRNYLNCMKKMIE